MNYDELLIYKKLVVSCELPRSYMKNNGIRPFHHMIEEKYP